MKLVLLEKKMFGNYKKIILYILPPLFACFIAFNNKSWPILKHNEDPFFTSFSKIFSDSLNKKMQYFLFETLKKVKKKAYFK